MGSSYQAIILELGTGSGTLDHHTDESPEHFWNI